MGNGGVIGLTRRDLLLLVESVSSLLRSGLTLPGAFARTATSLSRSRPRRAAERILTSLQGGSSLVSAMQRAIARPHPFLMAMVRIIDYTDAAPALMSRVESHLRQQIDFAENARTAAIYPMFVVALTLLGALLLQVMVLPELGRFFSSSGLLGPQRAEELMASGGRYVRRVFAVMGIALIFAAATRIGRRHNGRATRIERHLGRLRLSIPVVGNLELTRDLISMAEAVAASAACGVPVDHGLELAVDCTMNEFVRTRIRRAVLRVRAGVSPAIALSSIADGRRTMTDRLGRIEGGADVAESIDRMAAGLREAHKRRLARIGAAIEPALVLVAGIVLLGAVSVFIRPLFGLYELVMP